MFGGVSRKLTAIVVAVSVLATPASVASSTPLATLSPAPASPAIGLSPIVALSIFGSQASVMALCGSAVSSATASAQALPETVAPGQPPVSGCVLPVTDAPPALVAEAPPPGIAPLGILPLLAGLAGIGGTAAAIASSNDENNNDPPVSVN